MDSILAYLLPVSNREEDMTSATGTPDLYVIIFMKYGTKAPRPPERSGAGVTDPSSVAAATGRLRCSIPNPTSASAGAPAPATGPRPASPGGRGRAARRRPSAGGERRPSGRGTTADPRWTLPEICISGRASRPLVIDQHRPASAARVAAANTT